MCETQDVSPRTSCQRPASLTSFFNFLRQSDSADDIPCIAHRGAGYAEGGRRADALEPRAGSPTAVRRAAYARALPARRARTPRDQRPRPVVAPTRAAEPRPAECGRDDAGRAVAAAAAASSTASPAAGSAAGTSAARWRAHGRRCGREHEQREPIREGGRRWRGRTSIDLRAEQWAPRGAHGGDGERRVEQAEEGQPCTDFYLFYR